MLASEIFGRQIFLGKVADGMNKHLIATNLENGAVGLFRAEAIKHLSHGERKRVVLWGQA